MFDEAEQTADVNLKNPEYIDVKASKRVKRTRDEIYADLEVEEVIHTVEDKTCDKCGAEMNVIGKEKIRDELVYVHPHYYIRRHIKMYCLRYGRVQRC
ncbi:MAG: IS66 family transposase zinc-finger binding domain-containing protein [Clostridia bacterium]|nr:IS66 family transposase zinc-finger binding domain-containing protein [Clostridia bacterium]